MKRSKISEPQIAFVHKQAEEGTTIGQVRRKAKTDTAQLWTEVRDDRPLAGPAPPAALFHPSRDRRGDHAAVI